ncbi:MAG TPA: amidohydrolase family protein [Planctomycetota bacterium]|nr:amidohydrolase family protein [Planctomycetota bacterium]
MWSLVFAQILAVTGAKLVPADPEAPVRAVTVLVDGERITAVGEDLVVPEGARRIDGQGLWLCAAPIDGFAYWDADHDPLYASAGVALLADHGNSVLKILAAKSSTERSGFPALRIAGAVIDGFPPSTTEASVARTPLEAEAQLTPMLDEGIDFVAFQARLQEAPWKKLLEVAHKAGRQVWGPLPRGMTLLQALEGGQDGFMFLDALLGGREWSAVTSADFDDVVAALGKSKARIVPFLQGNARLAAPWSAASPELASLSPEFANYWRNDLAARQRMFTGEEPRKKFAEQLEAVMQVQRALLVRLHAAGAQLVPGSGAPHPWLLPGQGLHDELAQWQKAGLAPREILRLATSGAARALGVDAERGTVEAGKLADFVLLTEDPTRDVAALQKPAWIVFRGQERSRAQLDAALDGLRERQARAQKQASEPIEVGAPPKVEGELVLAGYCESSALGVRSSAERYTVIRSKDGKLSFCGLRVVPQAEGSPVEIESLLRLAEGKLEFFSIRLKTAKHELSVEGYMTVNQTRVERKIDGVHLDLQTSPQVVSNVDVGSVTTMLVLAATQDGGPFPVVALHESLEMEVVRWDLALEHDGAHYLRTPEGVKWARFDERGALLELSEQRGSSGVRTTGSNTLAKERPGLPFSAAKQKEIARLHALFEAQKAGGKPAEAKSGGKQ